MRYTAKYRQKGQLYWRKIKDVTGDGIEDNFRFFTFEDGSMLYIGIDAEVWFDSKRADAITKAMSKEAGTPIQRN